MTTRPSSLQIWSTCPATRTDHAPERPGFYAEAGEAFRRRVADVARWSEAAGCRGSLIYIDNSLPDNWALAQILIEATRHQVPLIATQPAYMHPYWAAKQITSLGHLYDRPVALNMLAGAFRNDLLALNDPTPHDRRYDRMVEYTELIYRLLEGRPVTYEGEFYQARGLTLHPPLDASLRPELLMSGSSPAAMAAARRLGAVAVRYPKPVAFYEEHPLEPDIRFGLRIGIVAREDEAAAWEAARERFPEDRKGQIAHRMAMKTSDSSWHKQLSALDEEELSDAFPYWLTPFRNYKTFCPYLVGTYDRLASIVARYVRVGFRVFITDIPVRDDDLRHQQEVFRRVEVLLRADPA
ncbi:MAG: LLM class flavin-dependent oxidoreductase [Acidobacteriota bacterium]|jgi:alkanesulfonate monooxygenase